VVKCGVVAYGHMGKKTPELVGASRNTVSALSAELRRQRSAASVPESALIGGARDVRTAVS